MNNEQLDTMAVWIGSIGLAACVFALIAINCWKRSQEKKARDREEAERKAEEHRLRLRTEMRSRIAGKMKGKTFCIVVRSKHSTLVPFESDLIQEFANVGLHADVLAQAMSVRIATGEDSPHTELAFIGTFWKSADTQKPTSFYLDLRVVEVRQCKHLAAGAVWSESYEGLLERAMDIAADAFGVRDAPVHG